MFKSSRYAVLILALGFPVLLLFQNCAQQGAFKSSMVGSLDKLDIDIADDETVKKVPGFKPQVQANPIVGNRILTANIFKSVFGSTNSGNLRYYIASQIAWNSTDFGSGESMYEKRVVASKTCVKNASFEYTCLNTIISPSTADIMGANTRREAYRMQICHRAVRNNTAVAHALKKINRKATLSKPPSMSYANIRNAFHLFFRSHPSPPNEVLDSLIIVGQQESRPLNQWKAMLLTVCLSPHWQVL